MNFNWISPKLAVAECELGKGQFATPDITGGGGGACRICGRVMTLDEFDRLAATGSHESNCDRRTGDLRLRDLHDRHVWQHAVLVQRKRMP